MRSEKGVFFASSNPAEPTEVNRKGKKANETIFYTFFSVNFFGGKPNVEANKSSIEF